MFLNKKILFVLLFILFFLKITPCMLYAFGNREPDEGVISFNWALIIKKDSGDIYVPGIEEDTITLSGNQKYKFFIQPQSRVYIYMFLHDDSKHLYPVFPVFFSLFETGSGYEAGEKYFIPEDPENWFYPGNKPGSEEYYIIALAERLYGLEKQTREYMKLYNKYKSFDQVDVNKAKQMILAEIKQAVNDHSNFKEEPAGPVPVAGEFRSDEGVIKFNAYHLTADTIYVKKITIKH